MNPNPGFLCIEAQPFGRGRTINFNPSTVGNKTGPITHNRTSHPSTGGEFSKQESYLSKGGPWGGMRPATRTGYCLAI